MYVNEKYYVAILGIEVAEPTPHKHVHVEQNFGLREEQIFDMSRDRVQFRSSSVRKPQKPGP
jgi:hypothetical protein